ncbi:MAG: bifunctional diaminohydroxyphosphoribosylaminopyrimidine deaminase/5-amino-6-(5-phosphoribosylamino)uracil reductase RibD [Bacteroidota bacterium]
MLNHEDYIRRCFTLARRGAGTTSPNPMVGALLLHPTSGKILAEGYYAKDGGPHAEVMAVRNVSPQDRPLLSSSTLYVSLEPCCIYGRTPPCTKLIIEHKIPKVVISCIDKTPGVGGQGVQLLREAGVEVITGILEEEGLALSANRQVFVSEHRPYVVLKFARSADGFFAQPGRQVWLSNPYSRRLVHKWRSELDAIMVGTQTALIDHPSLTTRFYPGSSPLRIALDRALKIPPQSPLFDGQAPTWIVTERAPSATLAPNVKYKQLSFDQQLLPSLLRMLADHRVSSLMVEGGAQLLNSFIEQGLWDEARVLSSPVHLGAGIAAPGIPASARCIGEIAQDRLYRYLAIPKLYRTGKHVIRASGERLGLLMG